MGGRTDFTDQLKIRSFLLLLLILKNTLADEIGPKSLIIRRVVIKESVLLQKKAFFLQVSKNVLIIPVISAPGTESFEKIVKQLK